MDAQLKVVKTAGTQPETQPAKGYFESWDGTELFFRAWPARAASNRAVIFLHRGHEHSGRIAQQVEEPSPAQLAARHRQW